MKMAQNRLFSDEGELLIKHALDRLTELKASQICENENNPHTLTGVVLRDKNADACVVEQSAVRWIRGKDYYEFMHPHTDRYMDNNMKLMTYLVVNFINNHGTIIKDLEESIKQVGFSELELEQIIDEAISIINRVDEI